MENLKVSSLDDNRAELERNLQEVRSDLASLQHEYAYLSLIKKILYGWIIYNSIFFFWRFLMKKYELLLHDLGRAERDLKHSEMKVQWALSNLDPHSGDKEANLARSLEAVDVKIKEALDKPHRKEGDSKK